MKRKPLVFFLLLLLFLVGAGFFSFSLVIPRYIEKKILPDLGRQMAGTLSGRVYHIGFSAADFGDIIVGDTLNPALSIGSIHAKYSLPSLLAKKLEQVRINGLTLHLEVSDGRLIIPGLDLESFQSSQADTIGSEGETQISLPIAPEIFQVKNGLVSIVYEGENLQVPFDLQMDRKITEERLSLYNFTLHMMPLGEEIVLTGTIDLAGNNCRLSFAATALDLTRFMHLIGSGRNDFDPGKATVLGKAAIRLKPFQLISANLSVDPALMHYGKTPVRFGQTTPDAGPAFVLEVERQGEQLLLTAQGFMGEPLSGSLALRGSVMQGENSLQSSGNIIIRITEPEGREAGVQPFISLTPAAELHGDFIFDLDESGAWKTEFTSPGQERQPSHTEVMKLQYGQLGLQTGIPSLALQGQGTAAAVEIQVSLTIPKVRTEYDGVEISLPEATLQAVVKQEKDGERRRISAATLSITLNSTKFQKNGLAGKADISLQGVMAPQVISGNKPLQAEGRIRLANAVITEGNSGVKLEAVEGNIPWSWPPPSREMAGEVKAGQIRWQDVDLGSFKGDVAVKDMLYTLDGTYRSSLFKGVVTKISGKAGIAGSAYLGELALQADMTPFAAINLGKFERSLDKSYFSGELGLDSFLKLEAGGLKGRMLVELRNGTFEFPEKKYLIKNIDFSMLIPALPDLRTAPAQTLHFAEAAIGNLVFTNGKLVWQLESAASLFLEEGVVQWAGGRIFTNAVRISPERKEFVIPFFCDRLSLTEILQQLGVSNAEGEGTVNGRIPVQIGRNTMRFEDGFLYSSPGQGGSVKVAAFDLLSAGIPKNTPQFAQVDFAAEALKNFQYNWVKLLLNSEGEDLVMQMQMDGKPVQSLPFAYDSQTGILQRVDGTKQGINQPIRIDVNFRLPLNRFLGYSGKFQDIMKKIK